MSATRGTPFATTHRMIDRVHRDATNIRSLTEPSRPTRFSNALILVFGVSDFADSRHAVDMDHPHLATRQAQCRHFPFTRHQLRARTLRIARAERPCLASSRLRGLSVPSGIFESGSEFPGWISAFAEDTTVSPTFNPPTGRKDVSLLAIGVVKQRDIGGTIRIVFDRCNLGGYIHLIPAKVDLAKSPLVPTTAMVGGDPTI